MRKIWFFALGLSLLGICNIPNTFAQSEDTAHAKVVEVFERDGCGHCEAEKAFWMELDLKRDDFSVNFRNISDPTNYTLLQQIAELEGLPKATPITLIGDNLVQGFGTSETTGKNFIELLDKTDRSYTFEEFLAGGGSAKLNPEGETCSTDPTQKCDSKPLVVNIPFFGTVDVSKYSLPAMSAVLGFVDGFNPCAMWVLVSFLVILAQIGNRRRMWEIAGIFILAEAIMYYLILTLWFTTWDFIGLNSIVTPIVGLVAIGGGIFFLYEWHTSDGTCKVTNLEQRAKTSKRISRLAMAEMGVATFLGIIALAFSVNVLEFACSIGIPQAFTKVLDLNALSWLENQLYMALYIAMYMIDDLVVFGIALISFEYLGITTQYSRWANLLGGILMLIIGLLMIFRPDLLVF